MIIVINEIRKFLAFSSLIMIGLTSLCITQLTLNTFYVININLFFYAFFTYCLLYCYSNFQDHTKSHLRIVKVSLQTLAGLPPYPIFFVKILLIIIISKYSYGICCIVLIAQILIIQGYLGLSEIHHSIIN
jgi:hypothetical protein